MSILLHVTVANIACLCFRIFCLFWSFSVIINSFIREKRVFIEADCVFKNMSPRIHSRTCRMCGVRAYRHENEKMKFMARFPLNPDRFVPSVGINAQPLSDYLLVNFPCYNFETGEIPSIPHIEMDIGQKRDVQLRVRVWMDITNLPKLLNVDVDAHWKNIPGTSDATSAAIIRSNLPPDHVKLDDSYHLSYQ